MSPFLAAPHSSWLVANELAFALADGFPVSPGHTLVVTRRLVPTWFDATPAEQAALLSLVNDVRQLLDQTLQPKPDGYNVGFNSGAAAGQTVPHVHVHVIPRYHGDVPDPRGGVRAVIPQLANYLAPPPPSPPPPPPPPAATSPATTPAHSSTPALPTTLTTGHPDSPLWPRLASRLAGAASVDILSSFVRLSGLDVIETALFAAVARGACIRILVSDYLGISDPRALQRLLGWISAAEETAADVAASTRLRQPPLDVRLILTAELPSSPASFHPKAWCIRDTLETDTPTPTPTADASADFTGTCLVVGSSNLSRAALLTGVEWNLVTSAQAAPAAAVRFTAAFTELWHAARPLTAALITDYSNTVQRLWPDGMAFDEPAVDKVQLEPRPWQKRALVSLVRLRQSGCGRALAAVATGMGKTWLAALDVCQLGREQQRRPRILIVAHRSQILAQAEAAITSLLDTEFKPATVSWYLGGQNDFSGELVVASIQKLCRPAGLALLEATRFDYAIFDEVHHAQAPTWRRVLASLQAGFVLGLTATPERADGIDVATLFDDNLACLASIGDGIEEESLVPFHYIGIADTVEYSQIPWRSGRFDPEELERAVMTSARMERLREAMQAHPGTRTIYFCCSRRHASFTRDWLRSHGLTAAAVFSGSGSDPLGESLDALRNGTLSSLCSVDLFNEGLDIPAVDRIVMLRPTESKVLFLQQLGRGLRTSPGKQRLLVLDFVGNHRTFASRLLHLLAIGNHSAGWNGVRNLISGSPLQLPPGCLVDLDLAARDLLQEFLPHGAVAARDAYRQWRDDNQRRPTALEFFRHGYRPGTVGATQDGWLNFVRSEGDLTAEEAECLNAHADWFRMLETTALNRSYKMIVLRVLLDREELPGGIPLEQLSLSCRRHLQQHRVLNRDIKEQSEFSDAEWCTWWRKWPIGRWLDEQAGKTWFQLQSNQFEFRPQIAPHLVPSFIQLTSELIDWRLAAYCASRGLEGEPQGEGMVWEAVVSHVNGKPILFLPAVEKMPGRPAGPVDVQLPDGQCWVFRCVKVACNVASPKDTSGNQLPQLLRSWFGPNAGLPGTQFRVRFRKQTDGWLAEPVATESLTTTTAGARMVSPAAEQPPGFQRQVAAAEQYKRWVPVYDLGIAAGFWGPESSPEIQGWVPISGRELQPGMFVAQVHGQSMQPRIPNAAWCLFRPCPAGSRQGRLLLVQLRTESSAETGGRYTVKRYHSKKTQTADGWEHQTIELQPINPDYPTIPLTAETATDVVINAEFVDLIPPLPRGERGRG